METYTTAPGPLPATPGFATLKSSDRMLAALCHLSAFVGMYFIVPLVIFFVAREDSPFVADHAKEVLNYHLSLLIYFICCIPLIFVLVGIPLMIAILIVALICTIIGTVRAANGTLYRYPMTIRFF